MFSGVHVCFLPYEPQLISQFAAYLIILGLLLRPLKQCLDATVSGAINRQMSEQCSVEC